MTATADQRGWGTPDRLHGRIVTVTAGGIRLQVNEHVAPLFAGFVDELVHRGYRLDGVADDWGYAKRPVRGYEHEHPVRHWSNHAWGLAVDLNATKNPMTSDGRTHTDMPRWVIEVARRYGLSWGGLYAGSRRDPMHFEFLGTPADAARIAHATPSTPPAPTPSTIPEDRMFMFQRRNLDGSLEAEVRFFEGKGRTWGIPSSKVRDDLAQRVGAPIPVSVETYDALVKA